MVGPQKSVGYNFWHDIGRITSFDVLVLIYMFYISDY